MLDTSILVAALDKREEEHSALCAELFDGLLARKSRVTLIAPHSVAELLHGPSKTKLPRTRQVLVVSFDELAAQILGEDFPSDVLKLWERANGTPRGYYKYDALILASAKRHRASYLLTLDDNMIALGKLAGIKTAHPRDFSRTGPVQGKLILREPPLVMN